MHPYAPGSRARMDHQRDSDKHGPRLDEEMKREVSGLEQGAPVDPRAEEWHMPEPGEDQPDELAPGTETEARSELARYLRPSCFPAGRTDLVAEARDQHAPDAIADLLGRLPGNVSFTNVAAVWEALGGGTEHRDTR